MEVPNDHFVLIVKGGLWSRMWIFHFLVGRGRVGLGLHPRGSSIAYSGAQIFFQLRLPSKTLTFQFLVVAEIFLLQRRLPVCRVRQIKGGFALFPEGKKVRVRVRTRGRNWVRTSAHPRRRLSLRGSSRMQLVCGGSFPGGWWKLLGSDPEVWRPG